MSNRSRGAYDLTLEDSYHLMGFNLATDGGRPAVVSYEDSPARADQTVQHADVPLIIDNLDAGMGFSRRVQGVPNGYAYAYPGYTRAPGGVFMPAGKLREIALPATWNAAFIVGSETVTSAGNTHTYLFTQGPDLLVLAPDGLSASVAATVAAPFSVGGWAVFGNKLYLAGGSGMVSFDLATGSLSAPVRTVLRSHLAVVNWRPLGVPTDVLVGISNDFNWSAVRWCPITADPMVDTNWSAPVRVGTDLQYQTHKLVAAPRHVYMLRPDGVWDMDELGSRSFNIAPWVHEGLDFFNGGWGIHLGDGLYYSHAQGLAFISTSGETQYKPDWAHPGWGLPYEGAVRGRVNTGALHNGWGLVGMWSESGTSESYVLAGRRDPAAYGQATHTWHGAEAVVPGGIQHMRVQTTAWANGWPELLITTNDATAPNGVRAYRQSLTKTGTPLQEILWGGPFEPADAASLFLPADPWERPSAVKSMLQYDFLTERMNVGSDILKLYAQADGKDRAGVAGSWDLQGTVEDSPYDTLAPLELTEGRFISHRIDLVGHPILRSVALRAAVGIELREARTYRVVLAWDNALKGARSRETADPERRMLELRGMLGRIVHLDDGGPGGPRRARVLQVSGGERRRLGGPARAAANGTEGAWALVASVTVSFLDHPFSWNGNPETDRFDVDRTWA